MIALLWFKLNWSNKFVLLIEYDGTRYHGFQWQRGVPTVQGELEGAIRKVCGQSSRVLAASRTDAGVHAKGQVVSFWTQSALDSMTLVKALNYYLPKDIAVKAASKVDAEFSVQRDAISREYRYYILNTSTPSPFGYRFALLVSRALDLEPMKKACQLLIGEHDFTSFTTSVAGKKGAIRHVYDAGIERKGELVIFRMVANSFLTHQVRSTVGLLMRLGLGQLCINDFCDIMAARKLGLAGPIAAAHGLYLMKVRYSKPWIN